LPVTLSLGTAELLTSESESVGNAQILKIRGRSVFSERQVRQFAAKLDASIAEGEATNRLVVDLAGIGFLSSAALAKLIIARNRLTRSGGDLKLCRLDPQVVHALRTTNLLETFPAYPDVASAVAAFKSVDLDASMFRGSRSATA
jgi:anti-anti-sigma factor